MFKISITFDELRLDASKTYAFVSAYACAELGTLDDRLLYSQLTENNAVFMFEGLPSDFDCKERFVAAFCKRVMDIAAPFLLSIH